MTGTIILIILLVLGLGILGWIFIKKLPQLRMVDPSTARESRSRQLKYEIMRQRVERAGGKQVNKVQKHVLQPIGKGFQDFVRRIAGKLTAVERAYQERRKQSGDTKMDREELQRLVEEGKKLMEEESWERAEKKFIEVISNDSKYVDAYEYLGRLYQYRRDYKLAKQTFQFLQKLSPDDASVIASLGEVEERLGNNARALKYFKEAVELSPKNPKYLDFLISMAIQEGEVSEAQGALDQLGKVNPNNKKIEVFERELKALKKAIKEGKKK